MNTERFLHAIDKAFDKITNSLDSGVPALNYAVPYRLANIVKPCSNARQLLGQCLGEKGNERFRNGVPQFGNRLREELWQCLCEECGKCLFNRFPCGGKPVWNFHRHKLNSALYCITEPCSDILSQSVPIIILDRFPQVREKLGDLGRQLLYPRFEFVPHTRNGYSEELVQKCGDFAPMLFNSNDSVSHQTDSETNQRTNSSTYRTATSTDDSTDTSRRRSRASRDKQTIQPVQTVLQCVINTSEICRNTSNDSTNSSTNSRTSRRCSPETEITRRRSQCRRNGAICKRGHNPASNSFTQNRTSTDGKQPSGNDLSKVHFVQLVLDCVNDTSPFEGNACDKQADTDRDSERIIQSQILEILHIFQCRKHPL